jgi:hypothetical protein
MSVRISVTAFDEYMDVLLANMMSGRALDILDTVDERLLMALDILDTVDERLLMALDRLATEATVA